MLVKGLTLQRGWRSLPSVLPSRLPQDPEIPWPHQMFPGVRFPDVQDQGVKVYNADGSFNFSFDGTVNGGGQFQKPVSIALDKSSGELVVLDRPLTVDLVDGARIQFFNMNGVFQGGFSKYGMNVGDMFRPQHITVDSESRIYITDTMNNVVLVYDKTGTYGPYSGFEGEVILLNGANSSDNVILYEWDVNNDGTYEYSSTSPTQSHVYGQQGTYTVKLRVTNGDNEVQEASTTASIFDRSPSAGFGENHNTGEAPLLINFTNSTTGYDQPLTYQWDFDNNGSTDSTETNPSYIYSDAAEYSVKLTVTDSDGSIDTLTHLLTATGHMTGFVKSVTPRHRTTGITLPGTMITM